jgi:hypothetical protein
MASHSISVTVGTDSIRVEPDTLAMTTADEVQWKSTNSRAFSLVFEDERPFGRRQLDHAAATARQRAQAKGRFKYSVVSDENPGLVLDPVVVVGDPPSQTDP